MCTGQKSGIGPGLCRIFLTRAFSTQDDKTDGQTVGLDAGDDEQRLDGGRRHDLGEGSGQIAAFGYVDEDAIGGVFGAGCVDVQLADCSHDGGGEQELILDLACCLVNQIGSHCFFHCAVMESYSDDRAERICALENLTRFDTGRKTTDSFDSTLMGDLSIVPRGTISAEMDEKSVSSEFVGCALV